MYLKFWLRTRFLFFVFLFLSTFQGFFPYSRWHYKVKETNLLFFFAKDAHNSAICGLLYVLIVFFLLLISSCLTCFFSYALFFTLCEQ